MEEGLVSQVVIYRALSRSHDAWALIALIALLSSILELGLLWKCMGL